VCVAALVCCYAVTPDPRLGARPDAALPAAELLPGEYRGPTVEKFDMLLSRGNPERIIVAIGETE
jgi:hypothetical protein